MTGAEALSAIRQHAHWPAWRRAIGILFIAAVLALIARKLGTIDWNAVLEALRGFNARTLLPAAGWHTASHSGPHSWSRIEVRSRKSRTASGRCRKTSSTR